jgi:hypothetical protein
MKSELNPPTNSARRIVLLRGFFLAAIAGTLPLCAQKAADAPATPRSAAVRNAEQRQSQRQQPTAKETVAYPAAETVGSAATTNAPVPAIPPVPFPKFDNWPVPPPPTVVVAEPAPPVAAIPALTAAAQNKTLYSFRAEGAELKAALAMFARANKLNIRP